MTIQFNQRGDQRSAGAPSVYYGPVTLGADITFGGARYLVAGTGGTATLIRPDGATVENFPLSAGINYIAVKQVVSLGTAADVFFCC